MVIKDKTCQRRRLVIKLIIDN